VNFRVELSAEGGNNYHWVSTHLFSAESFSEAKKIAQAWADKEDEVHKSWFCKHTMTIELVPLTETKHAV